jgi:hypothetical protein
MSQLETIFGNYAREMCSFPHADRLYRALLAVTIFDGTEAYGTIDHALPGLENETAAAKIKHAVLVQYKDTLPVSTAIEIVMALLNKGELS